MRIEMTALSVVSYLSVVCYLWAAAPSLAAAQASTAIETREKGQYASPIPKYIFADTLEAQEVQLKNNPLMLELAKSRARLASDPYRPTYHFVSPHKQMNDPNGLSFWQGRWHLFYQSVPYGDFKSMRVHWGHAVSEDLIHWRDLPYAIYPGIEQSAFSGSTLVEKERVIAFYPGVSAGQMMAISHDPLLLNWKKTGPVITGELFSDFYDSDIWKEGDTYVGVMGGVHKYYPESTVPVEKLGMASGMYGNGSVWPKFSLWTSKDLKDWRPAGELLFENSPFTDRYDDGSCPNFLRIGDKYILLYFSHMNGGQYLLGDYDLNTRKFRPYDHGRFNHGQVNPGGIHAPSASEDGKGGVIALFNINETQPDTEWKERFVLNRMMSLPQRLTLGDDKRLRMKPVAAIETLRGAHRRIGETVIPVGQEIVFKDIQGNAMELSVEIDPKDSQWVQLNVLRSPNAEEQTSITFYNLHTPAGLYLDGRISEEVILDGSRSTTLKNIRLRSPEKALVKRGDEPLKLRVFIDRSVVEVFVNDRQYLGMRVYPGRQDSLGVSLRARGQKAVLKSLDAWQIKPIWPVIASVKMGAESEPEKPRNVTPSETDDGVLGSAEPSS